jgi:hypothetical protein
MSATVPGSITLLLALAVMPMAPAHARIRCHDGYQVVRGQEIVTPYCQDEHVAAVARSYGMRVSGSTMRNNPNEKARVCRFIGHDLRVKTACQNYRDEGLPAGPRF